MHPAPPPHPSLLISLLIGALIVWRFYARIRRMVVRQQLSKARPWITVCVFPVLIALFVTSSVAHPQSLEALIAGVAIGVALGILGLRLTKFENTPQGLYYTPSAHLGIGLSAILILRVGYRALQVYSSPNMSGAPAPVPFTGTPITLLIFGALAGYYVTYAIGLLRWRRSVLNTPVTSASEPFGQT